MDQVKVTGRKPDEKSCGIVLFRDEDSGSGPERQYLVLHYPSGHFDFPKGHVEDIDESEFETAHRELVEETGIEDVEFIPEFREEVHYTYRRNGKPSLKQVVYFVGKTESHEVTISHEHQGFIWLPYGKAYEKLTFDNAKNLIEKAENFMKNS
jgi:bis(5'-nucleosidyl)-tetraphosphatase